MTEAAVCRTCRSTLHPDEIALTRKLVNRAARDCFCLACLAAHFEVERSTLVEKIRQFRSMGCTLFFPES